MIKILSKSDILLGIIKNHKSDGESGIYSICSSNKYVLKAAINYAKINNSILLIEATSNQVNQFGGYMDMTPKQFRKYVHKLLEECNYGEENVILGGDHLGPNPWQNQKSEIAMDYSRQLIKEYVKAGFKKIHLDTSFVCADDSVNNNGILSKEVISRRAAELCKVAEDEILKSEIPGKTVYVIGTEVPKPGGMVVSDSEELEVSSVDSTEETINLTKDAFESLGLYDAWNRVIAIVTQPGVEFGDKEVYQFNYRKSIKLAKYIENYKNLVYEAHSTDYQSDESLVQLVKNHFAILKVGPALTYAFREVIFKLEELEIELSRYDSSIKVSNLSKIIEDEMTKVPKYWIDHYKGSSDEVAQSRIHSLSDRIRYYWSNPNVSKSILKLINNISQQSKIPESLLDNILIDQFSDYKNDKLLKNPELLINQHIQHVIEPYSKACGMTN
jgi:D-tagatose-1,6-bisphosphate aldolase subunit GatZ/KbaZ